MEKQQDGDLSKEGIVSYEEKCVCPECGGSDFIEDITHGELICVTDGVVVRSNILDDNDVFQGASNIEDVGRDLGKERDPYANRNKNSLGSCSQATMYGHINGSASPAMKNKYRELLRYRNDAERPILRRKAQRIIKSSKMPGEKSVKDTANSILVDTHDLESKGKHSGDSELMDMMMKSNGGKEPSYPLNQVRHLQALTKKDGDETTTVRNNKGDSATVAAIAAMSIAARILGKPFSVGRIAKEYGLASGDIYTEKKNILAYIKAILSAERRLNREFSVLSFNPSRIMMGRRRWTEDQIMAVIETIRPSMVKIHGSEEGLLLTRLLDGLLRTASKDQGLSGESLHAVAASFCDRMNKFRGRQRVFVIISEALNVSRGSVNTVTKKFGGLINRLVANAIES